MTDTNKLFELAQLAEASYANFSISNKKDALTNNKFSSAQADEFLANWQYVTQQPDTASSFSGTLFKYIGNDPNSGFQNGQYVYALKGTLEPGPDLAGADIGDIVLDGLALDQIVDMYNDWHRIQAGKNNTYQAAELVTLEAETNARMLLAGSQLSEYDAQMKSLGYIIDAPTGVIRKINIGSSEQIFGMDNPRAHGNVTLDNTVANITGHSLGGHLADAFTRLFGNEALTVNGAGYPTGFLPGLSGNAASNIANLFTELGGANQFNPNAMDNLYGEAMPNFVTMDTLASVASMKCNGIEVIKASTFFRLLQIKINKNIFIPWGLLMCLTSCSLFNSIPTLPLKLPIAIHQAGAVLETEVEIEQDDRVTLQLRFFVNDQPGDRKRLLEFVGFFNEPGIPIPLRVKIVKHITSREDEMILENVYMTSGASGISEDFFDRLIDELTIKSGIYRIRIETIESFPQLSETKAQFGLYYIRPPKF